MYEYIDGRVAELAPTYAVIDVGGVGYYLNISLQTYTEIEHAERARLYVHHIVREDAQELFGFPSWDERQTFNVLTGINRVGARTALAILSLYRPDDLRRIVLEEDVDALTRVSGIGKKTAQHVFLELKYKLKVEDVPQAAVLAPNGRPGSVFRDVLDGLSNLGYSEDECAPVVKNILLQEPDLDVTGALRAALKALARGRL